MHPLEFNLAIVNKVVRHCASWLARQYLSIDFLEYEIYNVSKLFHVFC